MTQTASAGFEQMGQSHRSHHCGGGIKARWSAWEIGAMVAGFVVFWPLGLLALFLKWKNGEMWKGAADSAAPWSGFKASGFKAPDFSAWQSRSSSYASTGNAAFDDYKREQMKRLDEERRKLEDEQKAFRDFVEKVRRAKDQDEFDRFMAERRTVVDPDAGSTN